MFLTFLGDKQIEGSVPIGVVLRQGQTTFVIQTYRSTVHVVVEINNVILVGNSLPDATSYSYISHLTSGTYTRIFGKQNLAPSLVFLEKPKIETSPRLSRTWVQGETVVV